MDPAGLEAQIAAFRFAKIIIGCVLSSNSFSFELTHAGGHGAGMTNMIFAADGATVIEFPMEPHVDRCYGYMALALGFDYWLLPQVKAHYFGTFNMDQPSADALIRLLRHVINTKGLQYLLHTQDEL